MTEAAWDQEELPKLTFFSSIQFVWKGFAFFTFLPYARSVEFSHYKNTSTDFSTTANKCQDFSKGFVSNYLVFHDFMFILHSVQPCSLRRSIFKCWDWPSSGHNSGQVTLNLEEILQCWIQWSNTSLRLWSTAQLHSNSISFFSFIGKL